MAYNLDLYSFHNDYSPSVHSYCMFGVMDACSSTRTYLEIPGPWKIQLKSEKVHVINVLILLT